MPTKLGKGILVSKTVYGNLIIGPDALDENTANLNTDSDRLKEIYKKSLLVTDKININKIIGIYFLSFKCLKSIKQKIISIV